MGKRCILLQVMSLQRIIPVVFACLCAVMLAGCPAPTRLAFAQVEQTTGGTTQLWIHVSNEAARDELGRGGADAGTGGQGADDAGGNAGQKRRTTRVEPRTSTRAALAKTPDATDRGLPLPALLLSGLALLLAGAGTRRWGSARSLSARTQARRTTCLVLVACLVAGLASPARAIQTDHEDVGVIGCNRANGEGDASNDADVANRLLSVGDVAANTSEETNDTPAARDTPSVHDAPAGLVLAFDANGGFGSMENATLQLDGDMCLPSCAFERKDHTMVGWDVRLDSQRMAQLVADAQAGDVLRIANEAAIREGMIECELVRADKRMEQLRVAAQDLVQDGRITLVAAWKPADTKEQATSDALGSNGSTAVTSNADDTNGSGQDSHPAQNKDLASEGPQAAQSDESCEPTNSQGSSGDSCEDVTREVLNDMRSGQGDQGEQGDQDDQGEQSDKDDGNVPLSCRLVTLVSHVPGCEDVCVWMPEGEGRVPRCPFAWDRHRFVDWAMDVGQTYRHLVPGEELPQGEVELHAQWNKQGPINQTDGLDFSSCRLIVGSVEAPGFGQVLSHHEDVWLLGFDDALDAAWAYVDHRDEVDFVAPDITVEAAADGQDGETSLPMALAQATNLDAGTTLQVPATTPNDLYSGNDVGGPVADLEQIGDVREREHGAIALIDTGVNGFYENVAERLSVIDSFLYDDNGHGTSMLQTMAGIDPQTRVVSIRALNNSGTGSAASVYTAIETAIQMECKAINLSLCAPAVAGNAAVEQAIHDAHSAGIMVVGAAGNQGRDARWYVPGKIGAEAVIVGSCDSEGTRDASSNFGSTVDLYVPSASTSYASAKVVAWLAAHSSFGNELRDLNTSEAQRALGLVTKVEEGDSNSAPTLDESASFGVAWTHPTIRFEHHWSNIGWADNSCNGRSFRGHVFSTYGSDANNSTLNSWCGGNPSYWENSLEAIKISINGGSSTSGSVSYQGHVQNYGTTTWVSDGTMLGTTGKNQRLEAWKVSLSGSIAQQYYIDYRGWTHVPSDTSLDGIKSSNTDAQGWCGIVGKSAIQTAAAICLRARSFSQVVQVRYQNADGSWGGYSNVINGNYSTGSDVTWSRAQDGTYVGASVSYTVTAANTKQVSVARRTATNTIKVRYQNADGSWGAYANASSGTDRVGAVRKWSRAQDATYKAASSSITGTASAQTKYVDVARRTYTVVFKGNGSTGGSMGNQTFFVGQQKALATNAFTRRGHSFAGWNKAAGGASTSYANGASVKDLASADATVTLYAQWRPNSYTISLDANASDAQGQMTPISATYGTKIKLPTCGFERHLFSFVAWNTKADGSGTWYSAGQEVSNLAEANGGDVVLFAQWNPRQMRVRVPAAIHFVANANGEMAGPNDGVARVENQGEVSVRVRNAQTELYDPSELEVSFLLESKELAPGDSLGVSDLRGHTNKPLPEEREVGCIHWKFEAV